MAKLALAVALVLMMWADHAIADQMRETCTTIRAERIVLPPKQSVQVQSMKPAAVRVCKLLDYNSETYTAISRSHYDSAGVCSLFEIPLDTPRVSVGVKFMALALAAQQCPREMSADYVRVDNVSATDFQQIMTLLKPLTQRAAEIGAVFSTLPEEAQKSNDFESFKRYWHARRSVRVRQIGRFSEWWGIRSRFEISVDIPDGATAFFYVLEARKNLWGQLEIFDVRRAIL